MKLVSVIIPTFNVEDYIEEAVKSILNQTYRNIEVIIVDDCSTDKTYEILSCLRNTDNRIRLSQNNINRKIAETLNTAWNLSKGEIIVRMDGDDVSAPDRIEHLVRFLETHPEISLVGTSMTSIDANGKVLGKTTHYSNESFLYSTRHLINPCSHIWASRYEVYKVLKGYRNLPGVEDYDFLLRSYEAGFRISNIQSYYGYFVRIGRAGNTINTLGLLQRLRSKRVFTAHKNRLRGKTFNEADILDIKTMQIWTYLYDKSSVFLQRSILLRAQKKYVSMCLWFICSLCSPHQLSYLAQRVSLIFHKIWFFGRLSNYKD